MGRVAGEIAAYLPADAMSSDVGSGKAGIWAALQEALPGRTIIPAHPVAGTENSGPEAGFASLFKGRWCIIPPPPGTNAMALERLAEFWRRLGANVDTMDPEHHRSEEHTSELQSLMRCSYAVLCLTKTTKSS